MSIKYRWKKTDESDVFLRCPDHQNFRILYARTYTVRRNYSFSDTNRWIINLKKNPRTSSSAELGYKATAIDMFAEEAGVLFSSEKGRKRKFTIVPMPPSKLPANGDYDDRLQKVAEKIAAKHPNVTFLPLLNGLEDRQAAHLASATSRSVDALYNAMTVDESLVDQFDNGSTLIILDDVATSGASFLAAHKRLAEQFPDAKIVGVFWAKSKDPPEEPQETIE